MNNSLYNKNIHRFVDRWPQYADIIERDADNDNVYCVVENIEDTLIPVVYKDDKAYRLASEGHNEHILDIWVNAVNMKAFELNMFMFGMGNGMYVRRFLKEASDNNVAKIIVFEPDIFIIKECFCFYDMTDIINDDRFELIIPTSSENELSDYILKNVNYHNINEVHSSCYINYPHFYEETYRNYKDLVSRSLDSIRATQDMMNAKGLMQYNNTLKNHVRMAESYSLDSLNRQLPKDLPVIIVSSGPSLTRNINYLKYAKNRSIICSVDSALGAMDAAGIIPDIYITVDPVKKKENFAFDWLNGVPVIASITSPECVFKERQKQFIENSIDTYISKLNDETGRYFERWDLRSGGSVACSALKLFMIMGYKKIILVGQDLAYSDNKSHADTVANNDDDMSETLVCTDDIYGNKIITSKTLKLYKDWFEEEIELNKWCEVVDATEGGAYIRGTVVSTLSEAINKYCLKEADIRQCFNKCERLFEGDANSKFKNHIKAVPARMDHIIENAKKISDNYDMIEQLVGVSKENSDEMKRLLSVNGKMTEDIEDEPAYCYINYLNIKSNTEVENSINTVDDDLKRDIMNVCSLGKAHVNGIIESARKVREDYESVFN